MWKERDELYRQIQTGINSEELIKEYGNLESRLVMKLADFRLYGKPKGYEIEKGMCI